jgi:hypothetical protein|tara:strand:+ start:282 stop:875 length:594 start_codon:yes stop_codon:yes gene_type:complete
MAVSRDNKTISEFKSRLLGGGARPNLFEVELTGLPTSVALPWQAERFGFLCKAAQMPAQTIANIDVPFRGRIFKVAGDRTIENWSITIINDEDFLFRNAFEEWTQQIANLDDNMGSTNPASYMVNAKVYQLGRGSTQASQNNGGDSNVVLKEYEFIDIFPVSVGSIDLSYDSTDTIEEYTVEFAVQSYRLKGAGVQG